MSVKVSSWVWHETPRDLKGGMLTALLALADIADDDGRCVFTSDSSQAALAEKARMSISQFREVTRKLEELGFLESSRVSQRATKDYRILVSAENRRSSSEVTAGNRRRGSAVRPPDSGGRSSINVLTSIDQFQAFWDVYPRHVGKAAARAKFGVLARSVDPELIVAGARRLAADPNLPTDKNFIPHPTTWLNQGRWEDEALPPRVSDVLPAAVAVVSDTTAENRARDAWLAERGITLEEYLEHVDDAAWFEQLEQKLRGRDVA